MSAAITRIQKKALNWLLERGSEAVIDQHGQIIARSEISPFQATTYLRLVTFGHIESAGVNRFKLSKRGTIAAVITREDVSVYPAEPVTSGEVSFDDGDIVTSPP